ncbi:MAG: hypothetical protein GY842_06810 [bacterium]|nr:hypothetical protein [bacterium]
MAYVPLGNPIWSCQYRLHGGHRMFIKAGVVGIIAVGGILLYHRTAGRGNAVATTATQALRLLAWAQVALLLVGGSVAVTKGLMRDYTTKMIEIHRTSPMSSFTAVLGYLIGAPMQILLLFGAGVLLGWALSFLSGGNAGAWLAGNFFLLVASASVWSLAVFAGVGQGKPGNVLPLIIIAGFSSTVVMGLAPGLGLFAGMYALGRCQRYMLGFLGSGGGFGVALTASVAMLSFWGVAAARRYRKPHLPPLSTSMALTFVALWMVLFTVGLSTHVDLVPGGSWMHEMMREAPDVALIATLLSPLLIAHLPAAAAARMRRRRILGATLYQPSDYWSPGLATRMSVVIVLSALALVFHTGVLPVQMGDAWEGERPYFEFGVLAATTAALILAVWTVTGLLRMSHFARGRSIAASVAVVLLWSVPPAIDHVRAAFAYSNEVHVEHYSFLLGSSPVLTIVGAYLLPTYVLWPGLLVQFGVAVGATLLGSWAERILIRRRVLLLAEEAQQDSAAGSIGFGDQEVAAS